MRTHGVSGAEAAAWQVVGRTAALITAGGAPRAKGQILEHGDGSHVLKAGVL